MGVILHHMARVRGRGRGRGSYRGRGRGRRSYRGRGRVGVNPSPNLRIKGAVPMVC